MSHCKNCGFHSDVDVNYCSQCGSSLGGIKTQLTAMKKRLEFSVQNKISEVKSGLDKQISHYLSKIDNNEELKIGSINVPEKRKESVRKALMGFQSRIGAEEVVVSEEFNQWLTDLQSRLDEEKCIVCFQIWTKSEDPVVICKNCRSGGHENHLFGWVEEKKFCPLCRQSITKRDLIKINLSN